MKFRIIIFIAFLSFTNIYTCSDSYALNFKGILNYFKKIFISSPVKNVKGGSSLVLASRMGIKDAKNWAAHHIIPVELKMHRTLRKIGFDLDEPINGIALPTKQVLGIDTKLPLHAGSHPEYTKAVKKALDNIPSNLSQQDTQEKVYSVIEGFRKELNSGKALHKKYGAEWQ